MKTTNRFLTIKKDSGDLLISTETIIHCTGCAAYSQIIIKEKETELLSKNLSAIEKQLSSSWFFRIHQSHLVNLKHIIQYFTGKDAYVIMSNGNKLPVSRRRKKELFNGLTFFDSTLYTIRIEPVLQ